MKQLVCEMCGSVDLLKQDGVFVCQNCGTKYSVEEARKMMVEGTVEVQGVVKLDSSDELKKLYQAARNARETSDTESALKHYESISARDPDSWEALFYLVVLKTESIKNSEIASAAVSVSNCLPKVFELLNNCDEEEEQKKEYVKEIVAECYSTASWLTNASHNFYKTMTKGNGAMALTGVGGVISSISSTSNALQEDANRCLHIANLMIYCGNYIESTFDMTDEDYKKYAVICWRKALELSNDYKGVHGSVLFDEESRTRFLNKIGQYDEESKKEVETQTTNPNGGCYVATAVYGSYDCPQVWTLRRYRDYTLAETWYGRAFIRTYYAISPTLVKWFGHTSWFKKMWQGRLDKMVADLQEKGFESTPYEDKEW